MARPIPEELSNTVQHYLKCLYEEQQKNPSQQIAMGKVASAMEVTPGTATSMMKSLHHSGLVEYQPRGGTALTKKGELEALNVIRRHRLIEAFLVQVMELDWSEVHEEADRLEHAISDRVLARIDQMLGYPTHDPHGDPIPKADGTISKRSLRPLTAFSTGHRVRIARVTDESKAFLELLNRYDLAPGIELTIQEVNEAADAVILSLMQHADRLITLGTKAAGKLLAEPMEED